MCTPRRICTNVEIPKGWMHREFATWEVPANLEFIDRTVSATGLPGCSNPVVQCAEDGDCHPMPTCDRYDGTPRPLRLRFHPETPCVCNVHSGTCVHVPAGGDPEDAAKKGDWHIIDGCKL